MSRLKNFFESLKVKLTLGAVFALTVGMGVAALMLVRQAEHDTLASQRQLQLAETARTAAVLGRRVLDLQRALQVTASGIGPELLVEPTKLATFLGAQPALNAMFSSVYVASMDGKMRVLQQGASHSFPDTDLADRPYIVKTLHDGRPVVSEAFHSRISGASMIAFTYPLIHDGHAYGVLAGSINLASRDLVADLVEDDDSGSLFAIADINGRILAHPDSKLVLTSIAAQSRLKDAFQAWLVAGSPFEPGGLSLPQADEVVSICGVAGTDWVLWRAISTQELLEPLNAARRHAVVLVSELLVGMSVVVFALMTWLMRPLDHLSVRAQHMFDGTQDPAQGWPGGGGELGQLAQLLRDVGIERAKLEMTNGAVLKKLRSVLTAAPMGIAFTREGRFELVSAELCRMLGRTEAGLLGQDFGVLFPAGTHDGHGEIEAAFRRRSLFEAERTLVRADGQEFFAHVKGRPVDGEQLLLASVWTITDITTQVQSRELLEWSASHDVLTGLANRKLLEQRLNTVFEGRLAPVPVPAALVAIDLDRFKPVNDAAGHAAGDAMLRAVANAIASCARANDLVARTGGDEFALVLCGCPQQTAQRIARDVAKAIDAIELNWSGRKLHVGASFGVAMLGAKTASVAEWLEEADARCYQSKRAGRNGVVPGAGRARA